MLKLNRGSGRGVGLLLALLLLLGATSFFFYQKRGYYTTLSVKFDSSDLPCVDVMIEGTPCPLMIDLGSRLEAKIYVDILEKFQKQPLGMEKWKNFNGTEFRHPTYTLPKIEMGGVVFKAPVVVATPVEEEQAYIIWSDPETKVTIPQTSGSIGRALLQQVNLLFDMEKRILIATNRTNQLKKGGYDLDLFIQVPFTLSPKGMVMTVETDLGEMHLLLDTGFTCTMLHDSLYPKNIEKKIGYHDLPIFTSEKFIINGKDFGSQKLCFLKMTEELKEIDGCLGMDFIKNQVMYIDFHKKIIYIRNN